MASESSQPTASGVLSFLGVTAVLFIVTIVAIIFLRVSGTGGETLEQRRAAGRIVVRNKLEMEASEKLHSQGWVDKAKGLAHITIDDAMALTVAELRGKKPAPSQVKVEPPLPVIVPAPGEPPLPSMPSAPAGAHTIRFGALATPEPAAPAPAPAPAAVPAATPAPAAKPVAPAPAPAAAPAPAPAPAAPPPPPQKQERPPLINPTENPAPTK